MLSKKLEKSPPELNEKENIPPKNLNIKRDFTLYSEAKLKATLSAYLQMESLCIENVLGKDNGNLLKIIEENTNVNNITIVLDTHDIFKRTILKLQELTVLTHHRNSLYDNLFDILYSIVNVQNLRICNLNLSEFSILAIKKNPLNALSLENVVMERESVNALIDTLESKKLINLKLNANKFLPEYSAFPKCIEHFVKGATTYTNIDLRYLSIALRSYKNFDFERLDRFKALKVLVIRFTLEYDLNELEKCKEFLWFFNTKMTHFVEFLEPELPLLPVDLEKIDRKSKENKEHFQTKCYEKIFYWHRNEQKPVSPEDYILKDYDIKYV